MESREMPGEKLPDHPAEIDNSTGHINYKGYADE